jgi:hypothetical protein
VIAYSAAKVDKVDTVPSHRAMPTARELRSASNDELREAIVDGHPIDPADLEGWTYRGTSLGLPKAVELVTWKTFQKTFHRDPDTGRLVGWNVRLEQDGIDAPSRPKLKDGVPVTEWHYEVISPEGVPLPDGFDRGLVIDYSRGPNPPGIMQTIKDPLVALNPGSADELIGVSYVAVFGRTVETPTYFTLEREARTEYVPYDHAKKPALDPLRLTDTERAWAEALFAAIVDPEPGGALPPFRDVDPAAFWERFATAPAPLVRAGLRPMLHTLTFLPVVSGYKKPFFQLSREEQDRFLASIEKSPRYFVRQSVTTLKTLACFAYFEDPKVRAAFARPEGSSR